MNHHDNGFESFTAAVIFFLGVISVRVWFDWPLLAGALHRLAEQKIFSH